MIRFPLFAIMRWIRCFKISYYHDHLVVKVVFLFARSNVYDWMAVGAGNTFIDTLTTLQNLATRVIEFCPSSQPSLYEIMVQ